MPFNDPIGLTAIAGLNQSAMNHAEELWDTMCFVGCHGETFRPKDIIINWETLLSPSAKEDYLYVFLRYCLKANNFSGPAAKLTKVSYGRYKLIDVS